MARKENVITLMDGGEQKRFKIRQMSATKAERWVIKLIFLLGGQTEIDKLHDALDILNAITDKPFDRVQELLDGLLECCSRVHEGGIETQLTPENVDGFVEEMQTLLNLRVEAFKLNNFFQKSGLSVSAESHKSVTIPRKK